MLPASAGSLPAGMLYGSLAGLAVYCLAVALYRVFLGPLAHVPGPWYAKVTRHWLTPHVVLMRQARAIDALFERYGPVVCIGPNKVAFLDASANKTVYSARFPKDKWYQSLRMNGQDHAMTTVDPLVHALRRRGFAPHYAPTNLVSFQSDMHDSMVRIIQRLHEDGGCTPWDCLTLIRHLMVDVISLTVFDHRPGSVQKWANAEVDNLATAITDWPKRSLLKDAIPGWLWTVVSHIPHARVRQFVGSDAFLHQFVGDRVRGVRDQLKDGQLDEQERHTLVVRMLQYRMPSGLALSEADIMAELQAHTMAGTDTTATTASYLLWALSQHPHVMRKLQAELDDAMHDPYGIPQMGALRALPYLNAFIKEGLRLYSAAPAPLPRTVPEHCAGFSIKGYTVPPGASVMTQAWTLHRQESVFPNPDAFDPERWLDETGDMKDHYIPFGIGARVCGGQNLAMNMLRIIIASIARNFDIRAPAHTNEKTMYICEAFVLFPLGLKADLVFTPRAHEDSGDKV